MIAWLYAFIGVSAGAAHAGLLHREVSRGPRVWAWPLRFLVVGAALLLAAKGGHLLAGAAGWGAGFALAGAYLWWRRP